MLNRDRLQLGHHQIVDDPIDRRCTLDEGAVCIPAGLVVVQVADAQMTEARDDAQPGYAASRRSPAKGDERGYGADRHRDVVP